MTGKKNTITNRARHRPKSNLPKSTMNFLIKKIRQALASWRTTMSGVASILTGIVGFIGILNSDAPVTVDLISFHIGLITAGVGLIAAKDNLTRSEDVAKLNADGSPILPTIPTDPK